MRALGLRGDIGCGAGWKPTLTAPPLKGLLPPLGSRRAINYKGLEVARRLMERAREMSVRLTKHEWNADSFNPRHSGVASRALR